MSLPGDHYQGTTTRGPLPGDHYQGTTTRGPIPGDHYQGQGRDERVNIIDILDALSTPAQIYSDFNDLNEASIQY